ncbi:hypothetical protein FE257_001082 [Aspergillus nanangensis]|uniref:Uncharacterized protein n=1 Tax=Aspergillus nanangensis TaxID=2582783 RepID=A0AAD4CTZ7_ASPNN|nr:hypothetical protein FE257_001082 [Aspergillus nanangensis]
METITCLRSPGEMNIKLEATMDGNFDVNLVTLSGVELLRRWGVEMQTSNPQKTIPCSNGAAYTAISSIKLQRACYNWSQLVDDSDSQRLVEEGQHPPYGATNQRVADLYAHKVSSRMKKKVRRCYPRRKQSVVPPPAPSSPGIPHQPAVRQLSPAQESPRTNVSLAKESSEEDIGEQLTESLDSMFRDRERLHPFNAHDLAHRDFIYNVVLPAATGGKIRRRLLLDFKTDVNIMSYSTYQRLGLTADHYDSMVPIQRSGQPEVKPIATVGAQWCLYGDHKSYDTVFYVVRECEFDLLLGRPSVIEHQLYRKDAAVMTRLSSSYRGQVAG